MFNRRELQGLFSSCIYIVVISVIVLKEEKSRTRLVDEVSRILYTPSKIYQYMCYHCLYRRQQHFVGVL